jgi:uncharacterized damage-inducible protein DinB
MDPTDTLTNLFNHNLWANLRLVEACAGLTEAQLDTSVTGTFGSIRETFRHIARAEKAYFSRISTGEMYRHPKGAPPMTMEEIAESLRETGSGFIEWAQKVAAGDAVQIDWDGEPRQVPKVVILTQVINHATEHRAQIMVTLTQLGVEPPDLDSWTYFDEMDS